MTTGVDGAGQVLPAGNPFETQTMTLPMVWPLPSTSASPGAGLACFLAQAGSASIARGLSAGGFPSKVIVPVMDAAPKAAAGHNATANNATARHDPFPDTR